MKIETKYTVALAGNPNVGKSTVFNALTGLHQHTGNWPGKTVAGAIGVFSSPIGEISLVDVPGTYSLAAHSPEEKVAADYICNGEPYGLPDAVIVVCDACCVERNLILALQVMDLEVPVILCINLIDEAKKRGIKIDADKLEEITGAPAILCAARSGFGLDSLISRLSEILSKDIKMSEPRVIPDYKSESKSREYIINAENIARKCVSMYVPQKAVKGIRKLWQRKAENDFGTSLPSDKCAAINSDDGSDKFGITLANCLETDNASITEAPNKSKGILIKNDANSNKICFSGDAHDRKLDNLFTGKYTAYPIMACLLAVVFFITLWGAAPLSDGLSFILSKAEGLVRSVLISLGTPEIAVSALCDGVLRVLCWVIAVMLPPMAIFFPMFTLLEDYGYLPRVAYNLDRCFKKCNACGKQALTIMMGFGCNAAGVTGCRIIDSPRERLIAILTNSFVPCNGRFPVLAAFISILAMTVGTITTGSIGSSIFSAAVLSLLIVFGLLLTFIVSSLLSKTILRGKPSSFTLEMPPYRKPRFGEVIVRSIFDRTLFVLGRAIAVAAPAGLLIWIFGNIYIGGISILSYVTDFLDPIGRLAGMDGVIMCAFILALPAAEIIVPLIILGYSSGGILVPVQSIGALSSLFISNGWTGVTAVCALVFTLIHWPCSTTIITVKKETGSIKWAALSAIIPTVIGYTICVIINLVSKIIL